MGLFTAMFGKSATTISSSGDESDTDYSTWEREAHVTIPDIDLDFCTLEEYKTFQSARKLALSFTYPGENSSFLDEGKSYSEHIEECFEKDVLKRGWLRW